MLKLLFLLDYRLNFPPLSTESKPSISSEFFIKEISVLFAALKQIQRVVTLQTPSEGQIMCAAAIIRIKQLTGCNFPFCRSRNIVIRHSESTTISNEKSLTPLFKVTKKPEQMWDEKMEIPSLYQHSANHRS